MDRVSRFASAIKSRLSWKLVFILATIVALIMAIAYVYKKYMTPKLNVEYEPNKEFIDKGDSNEAEIIMFTVDWCPYCKKAMPIWKEFKEEYSGKVINGYKLNFETVNCTDEKDNNVVEMLEKYNIDGYPTIKLLKEDEVITFDAKPERASLEKFLQTVLGN